MANVHKRLTDVHFDYGTAGFRSKAELLDHVMYRMGMLAVLRARLLGASIGVMVTASHNPEEDNGVKLVDPSGAMMEESWEEVASKMANALDDELQMIIDDVINTHHIPSTPSPHIIVAMDNRPSSKRLLSCVGDGVTSMGGSVHDLGEMTTPQLHYVVRCFNSTSQHHHHDLHHKHDDDDDHDDHYHRHHHHHYRYYGEASEKGYVEKLTTAFLELNRGLEARTKPTLFVDGANGIGAKKLASISSKIGNILEVKVFNDGSEGRLNYMCGADYVKSNQKAPPSMPVVAYQRCCSFDGDADRIVFYCHDDDSHFHLLDGDKIAVLLADYVWELMEQAGLKLRLGLVQTAYANGASTKYIKEHIGIPVACTATGVKNLHKAALQFDIGVYFEANGHGTIIYNDSVLDSLEKNVSSGTEDVTKACKEFLSFIHLTNQTVGDAISDMLLVETVLARRGWGVEEWMNLYHDLPNKLLKIKIRERRAIETTNAEREVTKPSSLQPIINRLVDKYQSGRSFARPSGTEDVVRIYAEAATQEEAERLAWEVACAVYQEAGGVGDMPQL